MFKTVRVPILSMAYESSVKSSPSGYTRVRLYDPENEVEGEIDAVEGSLIQIDNVHHAVHDGDHYQACVFDGDVDTGSPKYVRITTPDTTVEQHIIIDVSANGGFLFEFYENPTINAAGNAVTVLNNNRRSTNTSTTLTKEDCTTEAPNNDGTLMCGGYSGGEKRKATAEAGSRTEWILERNEDYIVKVTPDADNTKVMINMAWYETSS